jgi:7-cyano-7-deazaguanine synthase
MIMLSIAGGVAVNIKAGALGIGVHAGDHFVYPDCRPLFIRHANAALVRGNAGFGGISKEYEDASLSPFDFIYAPFISWSKADIATTALRLGVPFEDTWSCYNGRMMHCGKCGTCVERLEAIDEGARRRGLLLKHVDNTEYEDSEYWKTVMKNA